MLFICSFVKLPILVPYECLSCFILVYSTICYHTSEYTGRTKPRGPEVVVELPDYTGPSMRVLTRGDSTTNIELRNLEAIGGKNFFYGTVLSVRLLSVSPAAQDVARAMLHEDYGRALQYLDEQFQQPLKVGVYLWSMHFALLSARIYA